MLKEDINTTKNKAKSIMSSVTTLIC